MKSIASVFVFTFVLYTGAGYKMDTVDMRTDEVAKFYKYPVETHTVRTHDGYDLTVHRLPKNSEKPPVMLMHGIMDSSATWLLAGPDKGLGFMLFDKGYDVWMGNFRGNIYSRKHAILSPTSRKYWDFSWHEMGKYDVPAIVDYILAKTNRSKLFHIGHSMGTTSFYVMTSLMPEYNNKIVAHFSFSPIGFWSNTQSTFWRSTVPMESTLQEFYLRKGIGAVLVGEEINTIKSFCFLNFGTARTCKMILHLGAGYNTNLDDPTCFNVYVNHIGTGSSIRSILHYTQLIKSARFRQYDYYNSKVNMLHYNVTKPPDYNISRITTPILFYYGPNDIIASPIDVYKLYRMLPNPLGIHEIEDPTFNHLDFTMGPTAPDLLYARVIKVMEKLSRPKGHKLNLSDIEDPPTSRFSRKVAQSSRTSRKRKFLGLFRK